MENKNEFLGRRFRDIVTGYEGICTGYVEWLYGCTQFRLRAQVDSSSSNNDIFAFYFEKQLELLDDGIRDKVEIHDYTKPLFFGKYCRDKVTDFEGICIGRIVSIFAGNQYVLEHQPEDKDKEPVQKWFDEGRIEVIEGPEIKPEDVAGSRNGGVLPASEYPRSQMML